MNGRLEESRSGSDGADGAAAGSPPEPPHAARRPTRRVVHGQELADDYAWLAERDVASTLEYLEAENRYAEAVRAPSRGLEEKLYREFVERIRQTDLTVPAPLDDYLYYSRTQKGRQYRVYCRRRQGEDAPEEILLDPNQLAEGQSYLRIGGLEVSPDHRRLAFAVDLTGDESYELLVKDLDAGELLEFRLQGVGASFCWANESETIFYTLLDAIHRPYKVMRRRVSESGATSVFREDDERFFVSVSRTRSRAFVLIRTASNVTSEVLYVPAERPEEVARVVEPRRPGVEYYVDHRDASFLIRTNREARDFRLLERPVVAAAGEETELVGGRPGVKLERVEVFADHLVLHERRRGLVEIRVWFFDGSAPRRIELPESVYTIRHEVNLEFDTAVYRFGYTSLVTPATVYECDVRTGQLEALKVEEVRGYERTLYETGRVEVPNGEVSVPVSFVHRAEVELDGTNPCLLVGYGAYGAVIDPVFSPVLVSLLERGFVFAIAHVRGGGLLGRQWHDDGRMLAKKNSFGDFLAVAEYLVEQGYTGPERLAIRGGSAGGLLVGAVLNARPDLFAAAVARVPFVDVLNTMLDPSIPLTVTEYEEWGNPTDREYFDYIRSYSPYDNVAAADYPAMLVTAGLNDPRVQYWEPAKWVAKLRARGTGERPLLLRTNMGAGHAGPSGRYRTWRERAVEYAFLIDVVGAEAGR